MTIEEFAERFGLTMNQACNYLYAFDVFYKDRPRVDGRRQYSKERVKDVSVHRETLHSPKSTDEYDFNDIHKAYGDVLGINNLLKLVKSEVFPKQNRSMVCSNRRHARLWLKSDVDSYFQERREISGADNNGGRTKWREHHRARSREIKDSSIIFFCTGRNWRLGDKLKTRLIHCSELDVA